MTIVNDADNVIVGSEDIDKIMLGSDQVWINGYIETPTLTVEGAPDNVPEEPLLTGSSFSVGGAATTDTHTQTDWEVLDSGDSVVWSETSTP